MSDHLLRGRGAYVFYHDPYVPHLRVDGETMQSLPLTASSRVNRRKGAAPRSTAGFRTSDTRFPLSLFDCVVIVTHHSGVDYKFVVKEAALIVDTRNATKDVPFGREKIIKL